MFLTGVVESFLVARGTSRLAIRKGMTLAAALGTGVASLGYAAARTPLQAAGAVVCFCLARECTSSACHVPPTYLARSDSLLAADQCNSSGFYPNLQEIGGPDTAALTAVANSIGQVCGAAVSPVAFLLHRRTGSWAPVFVASSGLLVVSGVVYRALISLRSGRQILVRATNSTHVTK